MPFGEPNGSTYRGDYPGMETNAQERAREREEAIVDKMHEALVPVDGAPKAECPGCEGLVHHTDTEAHARSCELLRVWAEGVV